MSGTSFSVLESVNTTCGIVNDQINSVEPKKFCGELVVQQGNIDAQSDHGNADEVLALQKQKCRSNDCNADQSDPDKISFEGGAPDDKSDEQQRQWPVSGQGEEKKLCDMIEGRLFHGRITSLI